MPATKASRRIKITESDKTGFLVGQDVRGFLFGAERYGRKFRVTGGCHEFTMAEARRHWSEPRYSNDAGDWATIWCGETKAMEAYRARQRLPKIIRMLDAIEAEAVKRGWLKPTKAKPAKMKIRKADKLRPKNRQKAVKRKAAKKPKSRNVMIPPEPSYVIVDRFGEHLVS